MCYDIEVRPSCYVPVTSNERVEPPQLDESLLYKVGYWWGEIGVPEK